MLTCWVCCKCSTLSLGKSVIFLYCVGKKIDGMFCYIFLALKCGIRGGLRKWPLFSHPPVLPIGYKFAAFCEKRVKQIKLKLATSTVDAVFKSVLLERKVASNSAFLHPNPTTPAHQIAICRLLYEPSKTKKLRVTQSSPRWF